MKLVKRWLPAIAMIALIFIISSLTGKTIREAGLGDESYHISGHFILFFFLCAFIYKGTKNVGLSILLTILYAFTDEVHQLFVSERAASFKDIATDSVSAFVAGIILWKFYQNLPKRLKGWLSS